MKRPISIIEQNVSFWILGLSVDLSHNMGMEMKPRTLKQIADMICGNCDDESKRRFPYRSSSFLTEFFEECDTDYRHDGSTRNYWVLGVLQRILNEPTDNPQMPSRTFQTVIRVLMDKSEATNEGTNRADALSILNTALSRENLEAFYGEDGLCYLRNAKTKILAAGLPNSQRPLSQAEVEKRAILSSFLDTASEDELIEEILLPLFRQLGYRRITSAGHKDKALEYGKDIWMKYTLPTSHVIYFGVQVKKGKLDAQGVTKNNNVAEILTQIHMMLGHQVFDPEINKRTLVDHAIIVAGGEITKQARNWLGEHLDTSSRSQILFMERNDILDLYIVNNLPLPSSLQPKAETIFVDNLPF